MINIKSVSGSEVTLSSSKALAAFPRDSRARRRFPLSSHNNFAGNISALKLRQAHRYFREAARRRGLIFDRAIFENHLLTSSARNFAHYLYPHSSNRRNIYRLTPSDTRFH